MRTHQRPTTRLRPGPRIPRVSNVTLHMTAIVLTIGGAGMLVSAGIDVVAGGPDTVALSFCGAGVAFPGLLLWRFSRVPDKIPTGAVFLSVTTSWVALSLVSTAPYLASGAIGRFDDAIFESIAGFTTTGATVLSPIEGLGPGILFWRSMTQWFGGMGVIVLAVAVLPFLGVGGLGLLQAEAPGPASERLVPRIRETAQRLWMLYGIFTVAVAIAYVIAGMSLYDGIVHSFTTVSTGGFSPYDPSIAHFGSAAVEWVAIVGMFLAAGSFVLYWQALRGHPQKLWRSSESRTYVVLVAAICGVAIMWNIAADGFSHDTVRGSMFTVISLGSTTGYTTEDYTLWSPAIQLLLLFAMGIGGMTGSTAGGLKIFRLLAVLGFARRQGVRQLHPRAVTPVRLGRDTVPPEIADRVVGFFGYFIAIGAVASFAIAALGSDMITAMSATAASLGNVGPGLGDVGPSLGHYREIAAPGRAILAATMLIGRLEIYPVFLGGVVIFRRLGRLRTRYEMRRSLDRTV